MRDPDEAERLNAYLDDELDPRSRAEVEEALARSPELRARLEELRRQDAQLRRSLDPAELLGPHLARDAVAALPRRSRGTRAPWLVLAAAAGFVLGAVLFGGRGVGGSGGGPDEERSRGEAILATLATATGPVEIRRPGSASFERLRLGSAIVAGALVRTVGMGKAALALADGSQLRLDVETGLRWHAGRVLELEQGRLLADVVSAAEPFTIESGPDRVEVLGTQLDLGRATDERGRRITDLTVYSGRARLGDQPVEAGYSCRAVDGAIERPHRVRDLALTSRWVHELLRLEGHDSDELSRRVNDMLAMLGRTKMEELYDWEIRSLAPGCVVPLCRYLSEESEVSHATTRAALLVGDVAGPEHVPELLALLGHSQAPVRVHAARALTRIRGEPSEPEEYDAEYWQGDDVSAGVQAWETWYASLDSTRSGGTRGR